MRTLERYLIAWPAYLVWMAYYKTRTTLTKGRWN